MKKHFLVPCLLLVAGLGCALAMTTMQNNKSKPLQQKKKKDDCNNHKQLCARRHGCV